MSGIYSRGILIIGGNITRHWRVAVYYGGYTPVRIYDSSVKASGRTLHLEEQNLIDARFPANTGIIFENMRLQQPDNVSCGVYSCAVITDILFDRDPTLQFYSQNGRRMREHLLMCLQNDLRTPFPKVRKEHYI